MESAQMHTRYERTARALIGIGGQLLVCKGKNDPFCHLPGGHCEAGEQPADTVIRELREECGREVSRLDAVQVVYNTFDKGATRITEEMHVFKASLYPALQEMPQRSREDWLEFLWVPLQDLDKANLLPPVCRDLARRYCGV